MSEKKIAIFHDYLNQYGGAERVLEALLELFPGADVYTFVYDGQVLPQFRTRRVVTSPVQCLPFAQSRYQWYFWLFPFVIKLFNFKHYDIVIVSTHAWGNGIRKGRSKMITYCHTPMRYIWDLYDDYIKYKFVPWWVRVIMPFTRSFMQRYDRQCAQKVDRFIANSKEVARRIKASYDKDALVIYPPVKVAFFSNHAITGKKEHYLVVSRLKEYKRIDLIIEACDRLHRELIIVGTGPALKRLKRHAGAGIRFIAAVNDDTLRELYATARAYIHMAREDFGMTMAEAQAAGTPVIAYGAGGACEIVVHNETGVLFSEQTSESLIAAITTCEKKVWDRTTIAKNAERFAERHFKEHLLTVL
jgi:glycosyltransferase involved in cell wall biosynthesis